MILDLDDPASLDPGRAGAKAAWLSRARQAGLPVLPGLIVPVEASTSYLQAGAEILARAGSGRARLHLSGASLPTTLLDQLRSKGAELGEPLVVRSSSVLEAHGIWSGAFTSYLDIRLSELEKAVLGCWASAFTAHTLERLEAAGLQPEDHGMAVLIQPRLELIAGGVARIEDDSVIIVGTQGSPAQLFQGWSRGSMTRLDATGTISSGGGSQPIDDATLQALGDLLRQAHHSLGAGSCEWGFDGELHLLQLRPPEPASERPNPLNRLGESVLAHPIAQRAARLIRRAPWPLGEDLVFPWGIAVADLDPDVPPMGADPLAALRLATELSTQLASQVWQRPGPEARRLARRVSRELRSDHPSDAFTAIELLRSPDPEMASQVLSAISRVLQHLTASGAVTTPRAAWFLDPAEVLSYLRDGTRPPTRRVGFDRWEPFQAGVISTTGTSVSGTTASPGIAAGRLMRVETPSHASQIAPRDIVVSSRPTQHLAPLLWDAAGLITVAGSPAAHLFESTRALGIPALCALESGELEDLTELAVGTRVGAIDSERGMLYISEM